MPRKCNFLSYLWDRKTKKVCGRTKAEWGQCLLFYFGILTLIFIFTFVWTISTLYYIGRFHSPWWEASAIGTSPDAQAYPKGTKNLITSEGSMHRSMSGQSALSNFLEVYRNQDRGKYKNCTEDCLNPYTTCYFDLSNLGPCAIPPYGYDQGNPCVVLKLNKMFGWLRCSEGDHTREKNIEVSCYGHKPADREHISAIEVYPATGFPTVYFPYSRQRGYLSPLVGVQIKQPLGGVIVTVMCASTYKGKQVSKSIFQVLVPANATQ